MTRSRKAVPPSRVRRKSANTGNGRTPRPTLTGAAASGAIAQPSAEHDGDFAPPSREPARTDQDRRLQARRALSVADQDVACGEGGVKAPASGGEREAGDLVNLEVDPMARYAARLIESR